MYEKITGEDPYESPMRIYPASHYTMGGLWVDYNLESTVPGLFVIGEANFSDHGANRLGASALMQGLADGYFILPYTLGDFFVRAGRSDGFGADHPDVKAVEAQTRERVRRLLSVNGRRSPDSFHKELGKLVWDDVGMARNAVGLSRAIARIPEIREEFWRNLRVVGSGEELNITLEKAGRVADFLEFAELLARDALERDESCGGHFREEHQTEDGEAVRDDARFQHAAVWEWTGEGKEPVRHVEPLTFDEVKPSTRSYK
jgi:succinate dehydrogenase / fumarate reductase flavoprotein subunit